MSGASAIEKTGVNESGETLYKWYDAESHSWHTGTTTELQQFYTTPGRGGSGAPPEGGPYISSWPQLYQALMEQMKGYGTQAKKDIETQYGALGGQMQQSLASRGLLGTSVLPAMQTGIARERQGALARLGESLQLQQSNMMLSTYGQQLQNIWKEQQQEGAEESNMWESLMKGVLGGAAYVLGGKL